MSCLAFSKSALLATAALVCAAAPVSAQFARDDEVRLRRDEPLHFKDAVFRSGKAGETFRVMRYDRAAGRVYLLALDGDGKPFALHCPDSAVEPAPKDTWALVKDGLNAMQQGDLLGARGRFVRASTGAQVDDAAVKLALHCETLRKSAEDLASARQALQFDLAEVARLTRNAEVADRPPLIPNDKSNQLRAGEIRSKAAALRAKSEAAVSSATEKLANAINSARNHAKSLIEGGSPSVGLPLWDAVTSFARKEMPSESRILETDAFNRSEVTRRINAAGDALVRARANFDAKRLLAALGAVEIGLASDSGRGDLKQLRAVVDSAIERARVRVQTARALADQNRRDEALGELAKAEAICADDPEAAALAKELRTAPAKPAGNTQ